MSKESGIGCTCLVFAIAISFAIMLIPAFAILWALQNAALLFSVTPEYTTFVEQLQFWQVYAGVVVLSFSVKAITG